MNTKNTYSLSNNDNRIFTITFKKLKGVIKSGNHTINVAYSSLSRTIQNLHKQGAVITNVDLNFSVLPVKKDTNLSEKKSSFEKFKKLIRRRKFIQKISSQLNRKRNFRKLKFLRLSYLRNNKG